MMLRYRQYNLLILYLLIYIQRKREEYKQWKSEKSKRREKNQNVYFLYPLYCETSQQDTVSKSGDGGVRQRIQQHSSQESILHVSYYQSKYSKNRKTLTYQNKTFFTVTISYKIKKMKLSSTIVKKKKFPLIGHYSIVKKEIQTVRKAVCTST